MIQITMSFAGLYKNPIVFLYYIVLAVLALGANPFAGETSAPVDLLGTAAGFDANISEENVRHPQRSDILDALLPQWKEYKTLLRQGDPALWNPYSAGGRIGITDVTRSVFTPSFLLFALLKADWLGFYFACLSKLVIAGFGFYLFAKRHMPTAAALFGGTLYALCGFHCAWFYWPQVSASIFIPWLFWALSLWDSGDCRRWFFPATVLSTVLLITGGFPTVSIYGLYAAGLWLLLEFCLSDNKRDAGRKLICAAFAIICGALITAPLLFGLLDVLRDTDISYRHGGTNLTFPKDLRLFVGTDSIDIGKTFYLGPLAACLAALALIVPWIPGNKTEKYKIPVIASFLIALCSLVIAFGLMPHDWIRHIPFIGKNPWNRLVVLIDFAASLLAALGFAQLLIWARKIAAIWWRRGAFLVLVGLFCSQAVSQIDVFHSFNNVAEKENFYPQTEAISLIKHTISPFQSVVADNSYLVSGTLGYYGLPEWFAHDFMNADGKNLLRQIVDNPYRSPTAASFLRQDIDFASPLFSQLGIRYFLVRRLSENDTVLRTWAGKQDFSSPPLPEASIRQAFLSDEDLVVSGIHLKVAPLPEKNTLAGSRIRLRLYDQDMNLLGQGVAPLDSINGRNYVLADFAEDVRIPAGIHWLEVLFDGAAGQQLKLHLARAPRQGDALRINGQERNASLVVRYFQDPPQLSHQKYRIWNGFKEPISVIENRHCPGGAYFVPTLTSQDWREDEIKTVREKAHDLRLEYAGGQAGFLVLPMRRFPGWSAYVNGAAVTVSEYLGFLPAIPVSGQAHVRYVYRPQNFAVGLFLTCCGVFVTLAACFVPRPAPPHGGRRKQGRKFPRKR
ncbi:MAG: hypothetical protein LBU39_06795 [Desulfobulbaceae bacterium]|jgi:hypothetical protein|nr:hypothetical protein [Desulfobulbaceae bacterium]